MVRIQAVVFIFHIFNVPGRAINEWVKTELLRGILPFEADASRRSSELKLNVRTSVRCPGRSTEWTRVPSGGFSLFLDCKGKL